METSCSWWGGQHYSLWKRDLCDTFHHLANFLFRISAVPCLLTPTTGAYPDNTWVTGSVFLHLYIAPSFCLKFQHPSVTQSVLLEEKCQIKCNLFYWLYFLLCFKNLYHYWNTHSCTEVYDHDCLDYLCVCLITMQLTSYGGDLSYRVYYEVDGYDIPTNNPDVILEVFFTSSSNLLLNYF